MDQAVFLDLVLGETAGRYFHGQVDLVRGLPGLGGQERVQHGVGGATGTGQQQQGGGDGRQGQNASGGHLLLQHRPGASQRPGPAVIPSNGRRGP